MDTGQTALITNIASSLSSITWAPNGKTIAFTMSVKSDEKPFKVHMPDKPKGAKWSPPFQYITKARYQADGQGLLDPAFTHIFVVPAEGGTARQLSSGNYHYRNTLSWAADSQHIFFSANRSDNWEYDVGESDIFAIDMSGKLTQITRTPGSESNPKVSPNGKYIAFCDDDDIWRFCRRVGYSGTVKEFHFWIYCQNQGFSPNLNVFLYDFLLGFGENP